ncbi:ion transporter [Adlercreutzia sp. R25]|uniref:Ion transporter n=1 Tax=Adlercreutzia shanghongiae TaxID=3111773 RepID=A0ABU6J1T2_9ACTN|nr:MULTISPECIES: ion transporter [unclassified Adlercreutzia]MEC4273772.1 ion transporter [Adlercreutzia sp. R25]MEC4295850.1 ion transporter [Adlercreutzia sp. R22]
MRESERSDDKSERDEERERHRERVDRFRRRLKVSRAPELKRQTFYALENLRKANWPAKIVGGALFTLILLNAVVVFVSTQPGLDPVAASVIQGFYRFSTVCFCLEYLARIWIADLAYGDCSSAQARVRYIFSPWGIIDLLSFGPNVVAWFFPITPQLQDVISVLRLVRLVKISRYMRGLRTIGRVVSKHYHEIVAAFLAIAMLVVVSSVVMYEIEHPAQPDKFNNLLSGVYWAVTTITGTGYGDLVPITPAGRIVGSVIMFLSVALVAIPGGIFSAGFVAEFQNANLRKIERDVRREDARQDGRDEYERAAAEETGKEAPVHKDGAASDGGGSAQGSSPHNVPTK